MTTAWAWAARWAHIYRPPIGAQKVFGGGRFSPKVAVQL